MPDFGLGKAIAKSVIKQTRKGGAKANVSRADQLAPKKAKPEKQTSELAPTEVPENLQASAPSVKPEDVAVVRPRPKDVEGADLDAEAGRIAELDLDDFDLDDTHQPNFDVIETTDDLKAVIADTSANNAGRIDEARRGVITNQQLGVLAKELDINEDVIRKVLERESGGVLNAETVLAARQVLNSSASRISSLAKTIVKGEATDLDRLKFRRQLQFHREYQVQFMGARAEAGRQLNAFRIPTAADEVDIDQLHELVNGANGYDTDRIAKAVALAEDNTAVNRLAIKYTQSKLWGVLNENFINSILSGIKTHVINTSGNIMMQTMGFAETAVAARIGRFLSGTEHVEVGEASALLHGTLEGWKDGFRLAAKTFRTGVALDDVVKFEGTRRRSISAEHLMTPDQRNTPLGRFAEGLLDGFKIPNTDLRTPGLGPVIRFPTERVMAPTDEFFKTLAYRGELQRLAFKQASAKVKDGLITPDEVSDLVKELMENPSNTMKKAADDYTRYVTFQNPLGPGGQAIQAALRKHPATMQIAPFIRTPVNIFKAGILHRSPLAVLSADFRAALKSGGRDRDMALARFTVGSATSATIAAFTLDGTITGGGPSNPEARRLLEKTGWQPYSVRVGDKYHSYARMEPIAFVMGATADATEILSYINSDVDVMADEETQVNDAIAAIIMGIAQNTLSKTYLQGIADVTEMMSDPKRHFRRWRDNFLSAQVPYSSFRAQLTQLEDPYLRSAFGVMETLKSRSGIPGMSKELPPSRDFFGDPRLRRKGSLLGPMSPLPDTEIKSNPTVDELVVLMNTTRRVPVRMPERRIEGMRLNGEEYDRYVLYARKTPLRSNGRNFEQQLSWLFKQPVYRRATPDMQVELIRTEQARYDRAGRELMKRKEVLFNERLTEFRQKRDRLRLGDR